MISKLDFVAIPSRDWERSRAFYVDTLGLRPDDKAQAEFWVGQTCFGIWEPKRLGMEFSPQKNGHVALHVDDVQATRQELEDIGMSLLRVKPRKRQAFAHRHERAEEVYVVMSGSGRMKIDDEIIELEPLDAVRVTPMATRQFEAGDDGLEVVAFGRRFERDGETFPGWWSD